MFDAEVYGSLLERLIQSDLQFSIDWQNVKGSGVLLLRHDVDFSVDYAHAIAKKEFANPLLLTQLQKRIFSSNE